MSGRASTPTDAPGPEGAPPADPSRAPAGTWLGGESRLARRVGRPLAAFVRIEAAGAILLALAVVVGLAWANSPWQAGYRSLWATEVTLRVGPIQFAESLGATVNDAAMVLFFFVIGLEIKREVVAGSLRHPKAVALPVAAAIGGMAVPAAIYASLTAGTPDAKGWAIPMATDVALALGALLLAGPRVPRSLVTFLLTLAVVDDIGVIVVIALFYSSRIHLGWLAAAVGLLALVAALKRLRVWHIPVYVAVGAVVWYATWRSGIHATIAGVALGLLTPARPLHRPHAHRSLDLGAPDPDRIRHAGFLLRESVSVADRLQHAVQPWVAFGVLPVFALANTDIELSGGALAHAFGSRAGAALLAARLVGKPLGILGIAWLATRLGIAHLPEGVRWKHLAWIGLLGAVGFTVSVYVASLAFASTGTDAILKLTIVGATIIAAVSSTAGLRRAARSCGDRAAEPDGQAPPEAALSR